MGLAAIAVACAVLAAPVAESRQAAEPPRDRDHLTTDDASPRSSAASSLYDGRSSFSGQHGASSQHLPSARENFEVVGKLSPRGPFADVVEGQIADVAVHRTTAYLNSWSARGEGEPYCRGGFFSIDISNPSAPRELKFVPAMPGSYHGEGAHALAVDTAAFKGDLLAVNNEICDVSQPTAVGGFDLFDVTDPANPKPLVRGAGDPGATETPGPQRTNQYHSVFVWQNGGKAYLVGTDNQETTDVDIFDITDPRAPTQVADLNLNTAFPQIGGSEANGAAAFLHDMVVKRVNGRPIMLLSYWDGGYVALDVTDPSAPKYVSDTDFTTDPLAGPAPQEGNGHQAEFSHDNRFVLGADEDFSPYRFDSFRIASGPNAGEYPAGEFGFTKPIAQLPDKLLNGPTIFGGYGCDQTENDGNAANDIPPASNLGPVEAGEERILVLERGPVQDPADPYPACRFDEKIQNGADKGYDAVLIGQRHLGSAANDSFFCGGGNPRDIVGVCITHEAEHRLFDEEPGYALPYPVPHGPELGDLGADVEGTTVFDGWGSTHLYRYSEGGKMAEVGQYAIEEAVDERFAFGFGDLSVHEFAADPTENVAYLAYYSGGMRAVTFGDDGIRESGKFIDRGGSNFWGVEQFNSAGDRERLIAGSDRDFGLYILRYTGPGAAQAPDCDDALVFTPENESVVVPLNCSDANRQNVLRREIVTAPANGTLVTQGDRAIYTPRNGFRGEDRFTFRATDGSLVSAPSQVRVLVGRCSNLLNGTAGDDVIDGTSLPDSIKAGAGDDRIAAAQGDDCVEGEDGDDQATGADGDDLLIGGAGRDRLFGDSDEDVVDGGRGVDHLRGGSGDDRVRGRSGRDYLDGGSNNDRLFGGSGRDSIIGGAGRDRLFGGRGNDSIDGGKSANRVRAGAGNDRIVVSNGSRDRVNCGRGRDRVKADRRDVVARNCERVTLTRRAR